MQTESALRMVSFGIVAANKPLTTNTIEVTPMEKLTMLNGELTDNLSTQNTKGKDADGASYETTTKTAITVTADWLPGSSNRKTAPDVRRGEKVEIWQYADSDKYHWRELEYDPSLRKLETVTYAISNTQDEKAKAGDKNTYFLTWTTHGKFIHLHTSTSDGEPFGYDVVFNTKDGNFQITDTAENSVFMDSSSNRIVLRNGSGSFFDLNGEDLFINVVKNLMMKVGGDFTTEVKGKYSLKVDGDYLTEAAKADFVTPSFTTSENFECGSVATINGVTKMKDDAQVTGKLSLGKGITTGVMGGGDITLNGSIVSTGGATFTGSVIAPNIH